MSRSMLASDRVVLLLALVPYLREHGPTSIAELAETFDVDPSMLRKLISFLGTAGIPGETLSYQHNDLFDIDWDAFENLDVVSLTHTVAIDETPRFTGVETAALLAGLAALQPLLDEADARLAAELSTRLGTIMNSGAVPAVVISAEARDDRTAELVSAIEEQRALRFKYRDAHGVESARTVHPLTLTEREGVWYLVGYNVEREAERTFRVAQMSAIETLGAVGSEPTGAAVGHSTKSHSDESPTRSAASAERSGAKRQAAGGLPSDADHGEMLAIVPTRLLPAIRGFAPEIVPGSDPRVPPGSALVRVSVWHSGAAVRLVQHGPGEIEIVSPPEARAAVSEWVEAALALYGE